MKQLQPIQFDRDRAAKDQAKNFRPQVAKTEDEPPTLSVVTDEDADEELPTPAKTRAKKAKD